MNKQIYEPENRLITFRVSNRDFAVPLSVVREVISVQKIDQLPGGRKPLEGLMVYRGNQALPVFSLTLALGWEIENRGDLVLVVELDGQMFGFRVVKIGRVVEDSGNGQYEPLEGEPELDPEFTVGTVNEQGLRATVLRLEKVFGNVLN